jgi:heptosyltransferase-2
MPLSVDTDNVDKSLSIYPEKDYEDFACGYLAGLDIKNDDLLVGMHPGSSEKFGMINRRWPVRYFAKLADMIIDKKKAKILVFGGPKEENLRNKLKELCKNKNDVIIVSSLGIDQVASLIKKCNLFISNDSGLMHLAAIQDIRTVGIFGPADPRRTGPYGNKHMVIRKGLECSPCWSLENIGRRFRCIKGSMECLESLGVDEVFDIIQKEIDLETLSKANKSLSKR